MFKGEEKPEPLQINYFAPCNFKYPKQTNKETKDKPSHMTNILQAGTDEAFF